MGRRGEERQEPQRQHLPRLIPGHPPAIPCHPGPLCFYSCPVRPSWFPRPDVVDNFISRTRAFHRKFLSQSWEHGDPWGLKGKSSSSAQPPASTGQEHPSLSCGAHRPPPPGTLASGACLKTCLGGHLTFSSAPSLFIFLLSWPFFLTH